MLGARRDLVAIGALRAKVGPHDASRGILNAEVHVDQERADAVGEPARDPVALVREVPAGLIRRCVGVVRGREDDLVERLLARSLGAVTAGRRVRLVRPAGSEAHDEGQHDRARGSAGGRVLGLSSLTSSTSFLPERLRCQGSRSARRGGGPWAAWADQ
jgi:hypothetical protein